MCTVTTHLRAGNSEVYQRALTAISGSYSSFRVPLSVPLICLLTRSGVSWSSSQGSLTWFESHRRNDAADICQSSSTLSDKCRSMTESDVHNGLSHVGQKCATRAHLTPFQPLSCQRGEYGELLIMPANGRWDLIRRLRG